MTTDVVVEQTGNIWDIPLTPEGDFENGDFFDTSLVYSLLGERRASASEIPISENRRGWIGNEGKDFENGSKVWLFDQSRLTRTTLNGIQNAALDGLTWLIEEGFLVNIEISAVVNSNGISLEITLFRFNSKVERRFFELWQNTGVE